MAFQVRRRSANWSIRIRAAIMWSTYPGRADLGQMASVLPGVQE